MKAGSTMPKPSGRGKSRFVFHSIANKIRAGGEAKSVPFTAHQVQKRGAVHFLQVREVEQRPQIAGQSCLHQLIQVRKMALK